MTRDQLREAMRALEVLQATALDELHAVQDAAQAQYKRRKEEAFAECELVVAPARNRYYVEYDRIQKLKAEYREKIQDAKN